MIFYSEESLFDEIHGLGCCDAVINTVNCVGDMGKGLAKEFKLVYPNMNELYREECIKHNLQTGRIFVYKTESGRKILNFPTKDHWRNPSKIEYITNGLKEFIKIYDNYNIKSVAFPRLGCSNGGLEWASQVKYIMEDHLNELPIDIKIFLDTTAANNEKRIVDLLKHMSKTEIKLNFNLSDKLTDSIYNLFQNNLCRMRDIGFKVNGIGDKSYINIVMQAIRLYKNQQITLF